jgi:RHS repeat-associated protein
LTQVKKGVYAAGPVLVNEFTVDYTYDSAGRMLTRDDGTDVTTFVWDGWDLLSETTDSVTTDYLVPNGLIHSFLRDGDLYVCHVDGLGSIRMVTDAAGDVVAQFEYGAWGELLEGSFDSVPGGLPIGFVGALGVRFDSATGLHYMRQRWYSSELQRFISRDPIGLDGGNNLYTYVGNSPTNYIDPTGTHYPGSQKCRSIEESMRNNRQEIIDRIKELNENKHNQPYDCPGAKLSETQMGHLLLLDMHYQILKGLMAEWFQYNCSPKPPMPPKGILDTVPDLKPKFNRNDPSLPPSISLPQPWWGADGRPLPQFEPNLPELRPGPGRAPGQRPEQFPIVLPNSQINVPRPVQQLQRPNMPRIPSAPMPAPIAI